MILGIGFIASVIVFWYDVHAAGSEGIEFPSVRSWWAFLVMSLFGLILAVEAL